MTGLQFCKNIVKVPDLTRTGSARSVVDKIDLGDGRMARSAGQRPQPRFTPRLRCKIKLVRCPFTLSLLPRPHVLVYQCFYVRSTTRTECTSSASTRGPQQLHQITTTLVMFFPLHIHYTANIATGHHSFSLVWPF